MGNKNSRINLNFDRSFYYTNEPVTGHVCLNLEGNDKYSNINSISVIIKGEIYRDAGQQKSYPIGFYTSAQYILASPQQPGEKLNFTQGSYSWPFAVQLNEYLPPSFQTPIVQLYYYLEVIFERSWYRPDTSSSQKITICPHVNLEQFPKNSFNFGNDKKTNNGLTLNGILNKSAFVWGETMKFKLEIFNTKRSLIKNITISAYYKVDISPGGFSLTGSRGFTRTIFHGLVPTVENTHEEMISKSFEMKLPTTYSPPSFYYTGHVGGQRYG